MAKGHAGHRFHSQGENLSSGSDSGTNVQKQRKNHETVTYSKVNFSMQITLQKSVDFLFCFLPGSSRQASIQGQCRTGPLSKGSLCQFTEEVPTG